MKASEEKGPSPRAYAVTPEVGTSWQVHAKLCMPVCLCV